MIRRYAGFTGVMLFYTTPDDRARMDRLARFSGALYVPDVSDPVSRPWSEALAATVGARVVRYRRERGMTAQQLSAELLTVLGVDMKRTVIGGLESGVRKAVALSEVFALAYVLGVPPLLLMTPLGEQGDVEVVPGLDTDTWDATRWITGEGPPPDGALPDSHWRRNVDLLALYREHQARENEWRHETRVDVRNDDEEARRLSWDRVERRRAEIEGTLRFIRRAIRGRGDLPPALPPELAHLDEDEPEPRLRPTVPAPPAEGDDAAVERAIERRSRRRSEQEGTAGE